MNNQNSNGGIGFAGLLLAIVFITLKLLGTIDWLWSWVLSPTTNHSDEKQPQMTALTPEQSTDLLTMLRQLESGINQARIIIKHDAMTDEDCCPAIAHARVKRAIQAGSEPFIIGDFAIIKV